MPSFCVVSNCELKYSHSENVSFHKFPMTNPAILAKWIQFTGRGNNWTPTRWSSICSRHFDSSDFGEYLSRKCLKKTAIPTIHTKNNIVYETYHITSATNSSENTRTMHSEQDDESPATDNDHSHHNNEKPIENCRLCGEHPDEHLLCNNHSSISLDDQEIDTMFRKCLPTVNIQADSNHSRVLCRDCVTQLRQYSLFIDKVLSYQRELDLNSNYESFAYNESILHGRGMNFCTKNQNVNESESTMFIKQEPINVKQEIFDNCSKKMPELIKTSLAITSQVVTTPITSAIISPTIDSKKQINVQQEIRLPNIGNDMTTYCRMCDRIFGSNFEFKMHNCFDQRRNDERDEEPQNSNANNCEIMEIVTLNNPISFIDLAEDDNAANFEINQLKTEISVDINHLECVEKDHAYAKRSTGGTPCQMKQEIVEGNYGDVDDACQDGSEWWNAKENEEQTISLDSSTIQLNNNKTTFECTKCSQRFSSQSLLDSHLAKLHTLKNKICSICSAEFKSMYEFLLHKNKMHSTGGQCKQCRRKLNTAAALKAHERFCINASMDFPGFCYSCRHCSKRFKNIIKMKEHLRCCTEKPKPNLISLKSGDNIDTNQQQQTELSTNSKSSPQKYTCDICYRTFARLKYFNLHNDMHKQYNHEKLPTPIVVTAKQLILSTESTNSEKLPNSQNFKAVIDNSSFSNEVEPQNNNVDALIGNAKFACNTCGLPFLNLIDFKQHQMIHDAERKYSCSLCTKTFKGISGLKQHISGFHYKIKPYSCPVCGYAYALKGDMQRCRHSKLKKTM